MLFNVGESDNANRFYYDNKYMQTSVNTSSKKEYQIQKGDSLWDISKRCLKDKNATNAEVQDMMYKIAKLNNMNSVDAINNIQVNDIIYLPEENISRPKRCEVKDWFVGPAVKRSVNNAKPEKSSQELVTEVVDKINKYIVPEKSDFNYTQHQMYKFNNINKVPKELFREHANLGIKCWGEYLSKQDGSLKINKGNLYLASVKGALHIVKKSSDRYDAQTLASMYVVADKNGKVKEVSFNSPELKINNISYDYKLDSNGNLSKITDGGTKSYLLSAVSDEDYKNLISSLQELLDERYN